MRKFPIIGAAVCVIAVCASHAAAQQFPAVPQQSQPQLAPPQQPEAANVVAIVNEDPITREELEVNVRPHLEANPQLDPQTAQRLQQQVLESLIDSRLVEQHLLESGPDVAADEVETVTGQVKEQLQSQGADYEQFLAQRGQTEESMAKRIEGSLAWQKYQQQAVTEPKLQEHFQANRHEFAGQQYDQVRQHVIQSYSTKLWSEIAEQARPNAEIVVPGQQPRQPVAVPTVPGGLQQ